MPLSTVVTDWYASNPVVRRLWVIEQALGVRVVVTLEPSVDGDDTHPAWVANSHAWAQDLQSQVDVTLILERIDEPVSGSVDLDVDSGIVMELCWRDPSS